MGKLLFVRVLGLAEESHLAFAVTQQTCRQNKDTRTDRNAEMRAGQLRSWAPQQWNGSGAVRNTRENEMVPSLVVSLLVSLVVSSPHAGETQSRIISIYISSNSEQ